MKFTVFTATYNRAHTLPRVYASLLAQTFHDFEWLIVDDGSVDSTREIVSDWIKSSRLSIRYFYQPNQHKKVAFNRAVREARGELFLPFDSDDSCVPNALERFWRHWQEIPSGSRKLFSAVTALACNESGEVIGSRFPTPPGVDWIDSNSNEIFYRYRVTGDKWGFHRTSVLKQHPFPEDVQGLVPEGIVWSSIARSYGTRFVNEVLLTVHAGNDRLTSGQEPGRDAGGLALWAREVIQNDLQWLALRPIWFMKMAANYTRFSKHLKLRNEGHRVTGVLPRSLVAAAYPIGTLRYLVDRLRRLG